ncbi:MAG: YafY family protein [Chloroflexota bacterium]
MYFPSTRLLNILDLLRANGQMSAQALATELEVDARTVRRYMVMLDDLGMPVETVRGRYGGYRLRPGYKLPPIVFSDDEVLALTMGLLFARQLGLSGMVQTADLAIAKMERAMPTPLVEQTKMLHETLVMETPPSSWPAPTETILTLSSATYHCKRIWVRYGTRDGRQTERYIDSYGLAFVIGLWYVTGYCHLRQALRTFRIDRIHELMVCEEEFSRPDEFDALAYVEESIARTPGLWLVEVILEVTMAEAKQLVPSAAVVLREHTQGVMMQQYTENLTRVAHFLLGLPCSINIIGPSELRTEFHSLSTKAKDLAERVCW